MRALPAAAGKVDNGACRMPPWFSICAASCALSPCCGPRRRAIPVGGMIVLECTDPLAVIDVPHFARQTGHDLVAHERRGDLYIFSIVKREKRQP